MKLKKPAALAGFLFLISAKTYEYFFGTRQGTSLIMEQIFSSKEELEGINKTYDATEGSKQHVGKFGKYLEIPKT
jgi:hypothetical protein